MRGLWNDSGSAGLRSHRQDHETVSDLARTGEAAGNSDGGDREMRGEVRSVPHTSSLERRHEGATERMETTALPLRPAIDSERVVPEALHAVETTRRPERRPSGGDVCECSVETPCRPSVICDPFGGTGTVAGVARTLGRYGISNDLSESYNRLAIWRITQSGHFTKSEQRAWADRQGTFI